MDTPALEKLARLIRYYILTMTTAAGSGHLTSSLSSVELATMLFFRYFHFDLDHPENPNNDRLIFSKGHATPLYYSLFAAAGKISEKDLMEYRSFDSVLEGHPTSRFPFAEAATGSLGQGLSIAAGEALALRATATGKFHVPSDAPVNEGHKMISGNTATVADRGTAAPHVYVLLGDGELAEGSVWEAAAFASKQKLNNLIAIVDVNRLGQSEETAYEYHTEIYQRRFDTFGWSTIVLDGHDFNQIDGVLQKALDHQSGPVAIIAKTIKGKGVSFLEDKNGWHGKALSKDELTKALAEVGEVDKELVGIVKKPEENVSPGSKPNIQNTVYGIQYSAPTSTRQAFGNALVRLGEAYLAMVVLDGDVQNSTYTELFHKKYPDRFLEGYIAEQNMVGVATGLSKLGYIPWATTFSVFFTRAFDQIRMSALSGVDIKFCGSHAGVAIGADGPSQMGLEDIAMFRSVQGSTVLSPSDAYATEKLVSEMMKTKGVVYMRTMRDATPIIYSEKDTFPIGGSKTHTVSSIKNQVSGKNMTPDRLIRDTATVVATGVTVPEALKAQNELAKEKIFIRVIDCYSIKPIDVAALEKAASETKALIVVEDHHPEGGLGEAVKSALAGNPKVPIVHLSVTKTPRSGKPDELLAYEGIDAPAIMKAVRSVG